jgi:hypothetical protein
VDVVARAEASQLRCFAVACELFYCAGGISGYAATVTIRDSGGAIVLV